MFYNTLVLIFYFYKNFDKWNYMCKDQHIKCTIAVQKRA